MSEFIAVPSKGSALANPDVAEIRSSPGLSADARVIATSLKGMQVRRMRSLVAASSQFVRGEGPSRTLSEQLYDSLAQAKVMTSKVAMHLDTSWRDKLFAQLDELLAADEWHDDDLPIEASSFATFLRLILHIKPERRPGLGVSHGGDLIAAWTAGDDKLTIECLPRDVLRWVLSCEVEGERERAAGETPVPRLPDVLRSYQPQRWFNERDQPAGR